MKHFIPFANESDAAAIGDLNVENRTDRVSLYGSIDLTRDKAGLAHALELQALVNDVVKNLQGDAHLPDEVPKPTDVTVKNPFSS